MLAFALSVLCVRRAVSLQHSGRLMAAFGFAREVLKHGALGHMGGSESMTRPWRLHCDAAPRAGGRRRSRGCRGVMLMAGGPVLPRGCHIRGAVMLGRVGQQLSSATCFPEA